MTQCPQCGKKLQVPVCVYHNVESYHQSSIIRTNCCGKAVRVALNISFSIFAVDGVKEDDWGNEIETGDTQ